MCDSSFVFLRVESSCLAFRNVGSAWKIWDFCGCWSTVVSWKLGYLWKLCVVVRFYQLIIHGKELFNEYKAYDFKYPPLFRLLKKILNFSPSHLTCWPFVKISPLPSPEKFSKHLEYYQRFFSCLRRFVLEENFERGENLTVWSWFLFTTRGSFPPTDPKLLRNTCKSNFCVIQMC